MGEGESPIVQRSQVGNDRSHAVGDVDRPRLYRIIMPKISWVKNLAK
jgi:hypothetical protein